MNATSMMFSAHKQRASLSQRRRQRKVLTDILAEFCFLEAMKKKKKKKEKEMNIRRLTQRDSIKHVYACAS